LYASSARAIAFPAVRLEPGGHVLAERQLGAAFNRDLVVVVDPAQVRQLEVAGERCGLAGDAFHQVAVAALHVHVKVEQLEPGLVVPAGEPLAGDRHADAVAAALAERAGRGLDAGRPAVLRVPRRGAAPLAEMLEVVQRHRRFVGGLAVLIELLHPGQMQERINQHRRVAAGEHVAIAVRPQR
jgi:hypothetical protein